MTADHLGRNIISFALFLLVVTIVTFINCGKEEQLMFKDKPSYSINTWVSYSNELILLVSYKYHHSVPYRTNSINSID